MTDRREIVVSQEDRARELLAKAFGETVHVDARQFLERALAGMFRRQPDMSGDQRARLNSSERRAVEDTADAILRAIEAALTPPASPTGEDAEAFAFNVGDPVCKPKGYPFNGFVVSAFHNRAGLARYVVEHATETGMLHIYSRAQLQLREEIAP